MSSELFNLFSNIDIKLDSSRMHKLNQVVVEFEIRDQNPLTLNGQMIGVYPIVFTISDREALFNIFHVNEHAIDKALKSIKIDSNGIVKNITEFKVKSDSFNLLSIWLIHMGLTTIKNKKDKEMFCVNVAKYLHYKYFTSLINHFFIHGANEATMLAVITNLSKKFDIIINETWKKDIDITCRNLISEHSKHYNAFMVPIDDYKFTYILSDTQTSIRSKITNIAEIYYDYHKSGKHVKVQSSMNSDSEGEKFIIQKISTFDTMLTSILVDLTNVNIFIEMSVVNQVASQFSNISPDMLRKILDYIVRKASLQASSGQSEDRVETGNKEIIYVGIKALFEKLIISSFRIVRLNDIPLTSKALIWNSIKNIYSSSRTSNEDVGDIKNSIMMIIEESQITPRESTKSSLRLAIIMYVIYKCLKKI